MTVTHNLFSPATSPSERIQRGSMSATFALPFFRCVRPARFEGFGYARIYARRHSQPIQLAHRVIIELLCGRLNVGDTVNHRCGESGCLNPYHLYVAGAEENERDKLLHKMAKEKHFEGKWEFDEVHKIYTRKSLPLSSEASRLPDFTGFHPEHCVTSDWLYPTSDGGLQLELTDEPSQLVGAERLSYWLFNGDLHRTDIVGHWCSNKKCLNPFHLRIIGQISDVEYMSRYDKRIRANGEALLLIGDPSISAKEVALLTGLHVQTVRSKRREGGYHSRGKA